MDISIAMDGRFPFVQGACHRLVHGICLILRKELRLSPASLTRQSCNFVHTGGAIFLTVKSGRIREREMPGKRPERLLIIRREELEGIMNTLWNEL
jgi:hypothetical protein